MSEQESSTFTIIIAAVIAVIYLIYRMIKVFIDSPSRKNVIFFTLTCEYLIDSMEVDIDDLNPKCKTLLMQQIKQLIKQTKKEIQKWDKSVNYTYMAYKTIYNMAFDLLSTGKFNMYDGIFYREGSHLHTVCIRCLDWYKTNGYITELQYKEQLNILYDNIFHLG